MGLKNRNGLALNGEDCERFPGRRGVKVSELLEAIDTVGFDGELLQEVKEATTSEAER